MRNGAPFQGNGFLSIGMGLYPKEWVSYSRNGLVSQEAKVNEFMGFPANKWVCFKEEWASSYEEWVSRHENGPHPRKMGFMPHK
ncbi:hypothetical protein J14TS2_01090 [Bacillus sp. J14TS2]|nr:hypothetical protein J14TS2_01090 [Bacillus sp. J14TS2]